MPTSSVVGRVAAILALIGAIAVVLLLVVGGGSSYTVTAEFENASQLVTGNNVNVAGVPVGSVKEISLSNDGQALVKMEISDSAYTPLPVGTHAQIRSQSLSGIANRYVDLTLPTANTTQKIGSGGTISQADTTSEVDLDQLFNTLDKPTVTHLQEVIRGFARSYDGVGAKANRGFYYLNPFLSTSRRVFGELNSDQANLEGLVVDGASLMDTLDQKSPEISSLVANLNGMLGTIGSEQASLASAVGQLPDFMRQFNTTAVNLRAALDDVRPAHQLHPPGCAQAEALRQAATGLRPRRRSDRQGPQRDHQLAGPEQRPDRAHPVTGSPRPDRGRPGGPQRRLPPWRPPGLRRCASQLPRPGLHAARLQPRAHRLVR